MDCCYTYCYCCLNRWYYKRNADETLLDQGRVAYTSDDLKSLPHAIQVTFKQITLRRDPVYPGTKLRYVVPVGTFLKPLEKVFFEYEGVKITFFRVEFKPPDSPDSLVAGWLLDYSPGAKEYVLRAVRSRDVMSQLERRAMEMATVKSNVPSAKWYRGNPRSTSLPHKIRIIGKTLAVRESPKYPGNKLLWGFDVGTILKPLEHKIVTCKGGYMSKLYVTSKENTVINFYRVEFNGREQGWLLDYSPGDDMRTLEILYR